jgi:hypothetical protein
MENKFMKFLPLIVGGVIFLIAFFVGIFWIDFSFLEALGLAAFLGVIAAGITWWQEHGL